MKNAARRLLLDGWLRQLPPDNAAAFLDAGQVRRFGTGDVVYGFAQDQYTLFGIVSGAVHCWITMNEQLPRLGHVAGPGFWFGEPAVIVRRSRVIEVTAALPTQLVAFDIGQVTRFAQDMPLIWKGLATLAVMNQTLAIGAGDDLMLRDSQSRLVAVLLRFAAQRNAYQSVEPMMLVPVTQGDLAVAANLSRSKCAAVLADLTAAGLIQTEYGAIRLLDPGALVATLTA